MHLSSLHSSVVPSRVLGFSAHKGTVIPFPALCLLSLYMHHSTYCSYRCPSAVHIGYTGEHLFNFGEDKDSLFLCQVTNNLILDISSSRVVKPTPFLPPPFLPPPFLPPPFPCILRIDKTQDFTHAKHTLHLPHSLAHNQFLKWRRCPYLAQAVLKSPGSGILPPALASLSSRVTGSLEGTAFKTLIYYTKHCILYLALPLHKWTHQGISLHLRCGDIRRPPSAIA